MIANAAQYERRIEMRVFISWSGDSSKRCAEVLRDWLPFMNQAIEPFVSSQDTSKGERGLDKIANKLQDCTFGIVCVTRDNQHAPWINFEAGALSRELGESMLAPFLLDLAIKDLSGPIAQFQATESGSPDEVWALVKTINEKCQVSIDSERLRVTFEKFRHDLEENLEHVKRTQPEFTGSGRDASEILNELVGLTREQASRLQNVEDRTMLLMDMSQRLRHTINNPREVTINTSPPRAESLRESKFYGFIVRQIGMRNIENTILSAFEDDMEFIVSADGMKRAKAAESNLSAAAAELGISVVIHNREQGEELVIPPS